MVVGRILRPHGVRGELRIEVLTDHPERLSHHPLLYLGPDRRPYQLESVRFHQGRALIRLAGCKDRNSAEGLRGQLIQIPIEWAVPLEEGEYYHFQVIGIQVITDQGEILGQVTDVIETGANEVYVVQGARGEILIPAIEEVVQELDTEAGTMIVTLLPGLLDEV